MSYASHYTQYAYRNGSGNGLNTAFDVARGRERIWSSRVNAGLPRDSSHCGGRAIRPTVDEVTSERRPTDAGLLGI
jgi:hypothetical protein